MVYKRYSSPFEEKQMPPQKNTEIKHTQEPLQKTNHQNQKNDSVSLGFLDKLSSDDIIIIALIIILLSEEKGKRDVPLILTLGFLFLIQYIDAD